MTERKNPLTKAFDEHREEKEIRERQSKIRITGDLAQTLRDELAKVCAERDAMKENLEECRDVGKKILGADAPGFYGLKNALHKTERERDETVAALRDIQSASDQTALPYRIAMAALERLAGGGRGVMDEHREEKEPRTPDLSEFREAKKIGLISRNAAQTQRDELAKVCAERDAMKEIQRSGGLEAIIVDLRRQLRGTITESIRHGDAQRDEIAKVCAERDALKESSAAWAEIRRNIETDLVQTQCEREEAVALLRRFGNYNDSSLGQDVHDLLESLDGEGGES